MRHESGRECLLLLIMSLVLSACVAERAVGDNVRRRKRAHQNATIVGTVADQAAPHVEVLQQSADGDMMVKTSALRQSGASASGHPGEAENSVTQTPCHHLSAGDGRHAATACRRAPATERAPSNGMGAGACASGVSHALARLPGLRRARAKHFH